MPKGAPELILYPRCVRAHFAMSAPRVDNLPKDTCPEVALIGRSNVGKSSLLNRMCGQKKLARTSATPGRTQYINTFEIAIEKNPQNLSEFRLVDLPGYGYAKVSKQKRTELVSLLLSYLERRENLKVVCLLNDVRREPEEEEFALRNSCWAHNRHFLVVLTKLDKLKKSEQKQIINQRAKDFELSPADLVLTGDGLDITPLWERIALLL